MAEVLDAAHSEASSHHIGEECVVSGDDQVASPNQHQARSKGCALHLRDGDLSQVAPTQRVLEVVVPFLQHALFGSLTSPAIDLGRAMVLVFIHRFRTPEVVP